jgi:hypothetical protein
MQKIEMKKFQKRRFLDFVSFSFLDNLEAFVAGSFLTPHGSRCATTVAIVRPLSLKGRAIA